MKIHKFCLTAKNYKYSVNDNLFKKGYYYDIFIIYKVFHLGLNDFKGSGFLPDGFLFLFLCTLFLWNGTKPIFL